jgi:DNA-binding response OmpR family regulator
LTLGAADYVAKPFNPDELVLRVARFVEMGGAGMAAAIERHAN